MAAARHKYATVSALPGSGVLGDIYYIKNTGEHYAWDGAAFVNLGVLSTTAEAYSAAELLKQAATDTAQVTLVAVPGSAGATGVAGQMAYDATHIYVCIATNTWVRGTLATWP